MPHGHTQLLHDNFGKIHFNSPKWQLDSRLGGVNQKAEALIEFITDKRASYMQTPEQMYCELAGTV